MTDYSLAFETSSPLGSVALLCDAECVEQIDLEAGLKHGRSLLPAAKTVLEHAHLAVADLAAISVSVGPGSYTGTRIGVIAAKALGFAGDVSVVPVSSLAALAWEAREAAERIVPAQDARRDEVYCAVYRPVGGGELAAEMAEMVTALQLSDGEKIAEDALRRTLDLQRQMLLEMDDAGRKKLIEDEKALTHALAGQFGMKVVQLADLELSASVLEMVPRVTAIQFHAVPIRFDDDESMLIVAISDPQDIFPLDRLAAEVPCRMGCVLAAYTDIQNALIRYYDYTEPAVIQPLGREAGRGYPSVQMVAPDVALTPEEAAALGTGSGCAIVGTAVKRYPQTFADYASSGTKLLTEPIAPSAASVGYLGFLAWRQGRAVDPFRLQPTYLRRDGDTGSPLSSP